MPNSHDHIVKSYDEELQRLDGEIIRMGQIAIAQLDAAIDVLQRRDTQAAMRVVANDEAIDAEGYGPAPASGPASEARGRRWGRRGGRAPPAARS